VSNDPSDPRGRGPVRPDETSAEQRSDEALAKPDPRGGPPQVAPPTYPTQTHPVQVVQPPQTPHGQPPVAPHPSQAHAPYGYDPQTGQPLAYPYPYPQQHYPQGYPPQAHPQGYPPPQGYAQQGHPPQAYPQQAYPHQAYPQQGYPQQGYPHGHAYPGPPMVQGYGAPAPINIVVQNTTSLGGVASAGLVRVGNKQRMVAALLAFFLGSIGAHKFYLGRPVAGVLYLVFFWTLIPAFVALVDFIVLLVMSDHDFDIKYNTALAR
jgi:TM2 domain-containing membrane protein YozV